MQARNRIFCEVVQIDSTPKDARYTKERDWRMESDRPLVDMADKECCSGAQLDKGVTLRQPL